MEFVKHIFFCKCRDKRTLCTFSFSSMERVVASLPLESIFESSTCVSWLQSGDYGGPGFPAVLHLQLQLATPLRRLQLIMHLHLHRFYGIFPGRHTIQQSLGQCNCRPKVSNYIVSHYDQQQGYEIAIAMATSTTPTPSDHCFCYVVAGLLV